MTSFDLLLDQEPFIAGYAVTGSVLLNFRLLQADGIETIYVKLTGRMYGTRGDSEKSESRSINFVYHKVPIGTRGQAYPSPGSDVLTLPFQLPLGVDLPPSFTANVRRLRLVVRYKLHVTGERPGLLKHNKEIKRSITIQPNDTVSEVVQTHLGVGWDGPWTAIRASERISRYVMWGEHADVDVRNETQLTVPAIDAVPMNATIPFILSMTTLSRPYPQDYEGELWPSPPRRPEAYEFAIKEDMIIHIRRPQTACITLRQSLGHTQLEHAEKQWIPSTGGQGKWKQEATLKSSITLQCPPTFTFMWEGSIRLAVSVRCFLIAFRVMSTYLLTLIVSCQYRLCVTVKFGAMRALTFEQPITVVRERKA
ncbi:hypothetical protein EVJ58_g2393 [Rhodofomes roseus]|uniref:Arrestin-like N-terminal domain-containing protein n=1 Tax=Rhodofomes roseus TaxID=34475 RepID=A0A4Y9YQX1_9APHY|nr:hypothetical protein EVJ58_g2393 [Rhodofomes roseus]